ncbi:MAG: ATP-binding cassette domain-containing protein [Candidatus Omnitrophica bacterium]|nr:ATP-binding cassette domain-containing protein [Candidatus Omnitrophota bacterium]
MSAPIIRLEHIKKYFPVERGIFRRVTGAIRAVDDVGFSVMSGHTLGIVGESGCGKTTLAKIIACLVPPDAGSLFFEENNILKGDAGRLRQFRRRVQIIFQDPFSSLNPKLKIFDSIAEPMHIHALYPKQEIPDRVRELLVSVGLGGVDPYRYPRALSGGQRQRIVIARALAANPSLLLLDEPVASLDVSMQAQILNLFTELQEQFRLSYILISHDLRIIASLSDEIAVMYMGKIIEQGPKENIVHTPLHPYTRGLLDSGIFSLAGTRRITPAIKGDIPSHIRLPEGCRFHTRCPRARFPACRTAPALAEKKQGHYVACHFA